MATTLTCGEPKWFKRRSFSNPLANDDDFPVAVNHQEATAAAERSATTASEPFS
jgi:hypothetical protein